MSKHYDAIIIGGGHNGLVCATYLAQAGRDVVVLEANEKVGGAGRTEEFAPGFNVSSCAHLLNHLNNDVERDLDLAKCGLEFSDQNLSTLALSTSGDHIKINGDTIAPMGKAKISDADRAALKDINKRLGKIAGVLKPLFNKKPPRIKPEEFSDKLALLKLGLDIKMLGRTSMQELLRIVLLNTADYMEAELENEHLTAVLAMDGCWGAHLAPRSPNSVMTLLHRIAGASERGLAAPKGGMGAVINAITNAAKNAGVEIRTNARVKTITVDEDHVTGVELETGEVVTAKIVASGTDPKTTFLKLLPVIHQDAHFVRRIDAIRAKGSACKFHIALDKLPNFTGLGPADLGARMVIAPNIHYIEKAFNPIKYGELPENPVMEITIPSLNDASLAPKGKHVMSVIVQYAPYDLKGGWTDKARAQIQENALNVLAQYAPDIRQCINSSEFLTPVDLENRFGLPGGHWHHGELQMDQMFMMRPIYGSAQYNAPVPGLYLCGAGAHPGGNISGTAGKNAAQRILEREAK